MAKNNPHASPKKARSRAAMLKERAALLRAKSVALVKEATELIDAAVQEENRENSTFSREKNHRIVSHRLMVMHLDGRTNTHLAELRNVTPSAVRERLIKHDRWLFVQTGKHWYKNRAINNSPLPTLEEIHCIGRMQLSLDTTAEEFKRFLSVRTANSLQNGGFLGDMTLRQFPTKEACRCIKNMGSKSIAEITQVFSKYHLLVPGWTILNEHSALWSLH